MILKRILPIVFCLVLSVTLISCVDENKNDSDKNQSSAAAPVTMSSDLSTAVPTEKPKLKTVPWGKDGFTDFLPECTFGAVTQITVGDYTCLVLVEQIEEQETLAYIDLLVQQGFSYNDGTADLHTVGRNYVKSGMSVNVVHTSGMMTLMISK